MKSERMKAREEAERIVAESFMNDNSPNDVQRIFLDELKNRTQSVAGMPFLKDDPDFAKRITFINGVPFPLSERLAE